jgi:hypothetical protein
LEEWEDIMASITYINAATDAVIARLNANKASLGNFTRISERDEDPAVLSTSGDMPIMIVIPLADRPDRLTWTQGETGGELRHDFSISIIGYHLYSTLDDDLRTLRGYAFTVADLFRLGATSQVGSAHVNSATVDVGYFVMIDYPIYRFICTLNLKMIEP